MNTPFILFDNGDVSLFTSVEALALYVESPDIAGYLATDRNGRIVRLMHSSDHGSGGSSKLVIPVSEVMACPTDELLNHDEFRRRVSQFLRQVSVQIDESASTEELLELLERSIGYTA